MNKFGTTLVSRQQGKEAYLAFLPTLRGVKKDELVELDFSGVLTFAPSWGDEFISPLIATYGDHLRFAFAKENPSVQMTLELLEEIHHIRFAYVEEK